MGPVPLRRTGLEHTVSKVTARLSQHLMLLGQRAQTMDATSRHDPLLRGAADPRPPQHRDRRH
jgi:hypothetical protein